MEFWREPLLLKNKQKQQFTESRICASASRFAALSVGDVKKNMTAQETPESQLQVARAVINEYHQPRTSNSSNSSQRQLQQKTLPLKMTVSRTAKRKLDFPAVQNKRRHFFSQCESVKNADDQPYFYSPFSQGTEPAVSSARSRKSQLGAFATNFKAVQKNFYSGKSYFYVPQCTQDLQNEEENIFEEENLAISHEELISKYCGHQDDADLTDEGGLSAVERSYSNLMALANEDIIKPSGFGDLMENSSPALSSFGQMFSTAKENFYSHEIDHNDESSSLTNSPKSTTAKENFYSLEIADQDEYSSTSLPKSVLGNLFDVPWPPALTMSCSQEEAERLAKSASIEAFNEKLGTMDTPELLEVIKQLRKECHEMF